MINLPNHDFCERKSCRKFLIVTWFVTLSQTTSSSEVGSVKNFAENVTTS